MAVALEQQELAAEYHRVLTSKPENRGAVARIAEILGLSESTVYDYLYGKIKIGRRFEHAAFQATNDPEIRAMLEPQGWRLAPDPAHRKPSGDVEREMGDAHMVLGQLHQALRDGVKGDNRLDRVERETVRRLVDRLKGEVADIEALLDRAEANHGRLGEGG